MGYSSNKPYQRTSYRGPTDPSFDRYLKEGTLISNKESVLEKPYNNKTYATMQQDFNPPPIPPWDWDPFKPPPIIPPGPPPPGIFPPGGTGDLTCYYISQGCEQLVGCWAGSDLVLDGPEAATAGYLPPVVSQGEIVSQTISGSENRGIEFVLNPLVPRNTFTVSFKDANGVIASETVDITCAEPPSWTSDYPTCFESTGNKPTAVALSNGYLHIFSDGTTSGNRRLTHIIWDGSSYSCTGLADLAYECAACVDSSDNIYIAYTDNDGGAQQIIKVGIYNGSTWSYETVKDFGSDYGAISSISIELDSNGYLHIIAGIMPVNSTPFDYNIYHYTNSSGSWQEEIIVSAIHYSAVLDFYIDGTTIHLAYWHRESGTTSYLEYLFGSWGSWSASTTIKSGSSFYDNIDFFKTADGYKHIITAYGSYCREYLYTSSWSEVTIYSLSVVNRYPHAAAVANTIYGFILLSLLGDYYVTGVKKNGSWGTLTQSGIEEYGGLGSGGAVIYNQTAGVIHFVFNDQYSNVINSRIAI